MFGAFGAVGHVGRYMDAKYKKRKVRKVTQREFVRLMVATGKSKDDAKSQAKIAKIMGSQCLVGDEWLEIK